MHPLNVPRLPGYKHEIKKQEQKMIFLKSLLETEIEYNSRNGKRCQLPIHFQWGIKLFL
jgi:hypothetical protein